MGKEVEDAGIAEDKMEEWGMWGELGKLEQEGIGSFVGFEGSD